MPLPPSLLPLSLSLSLSLRCGEVSRRYEARDGDHAVWRRLATTARTRLEAYNILKLPSRGSGRRIKMGVAVTVAA